MNEALITNHNDVVSDKDIVWFLGDFGFAADNVLMSILRRLNGQKNIILGNHDKAFSKKSRNFIGSGLFNSIHSYHEITVERQHIVLFHYGMRVWNRAHHGSWHLYGHSHGALPPHFRSMDVGVDSKEITHEYRPYSFEEIKEFMSKRETVTF